MKDVLSRLPAAEGVDTVELACTQPLSGIQGWFQAASCGAQGVDKVELVCTQPLPGFVRVLGFQAASCGAQGVDKVELVYTKFVSLISSEPTIQTLLPLTPQVRYLFVSGQCMDGRWRALS